MDVCPKPIILTSLTTFKPSPTHPPLMETSRILGIAGIVIVIAAACFAAGLMFNDNGDDQGDGGDSSDSGSDKPVLEYSIELREYPDGFGLTVRFDAPESGSFRVYLGDEPLENRIGEPIVHRWSSPMYDAPGWSLKYKAGQDFQYIQNNLRVEFSSNFDAVQV